MRLPPRLRLTEALSAALALTLHAGAFYLLLDEMRQPGATDIPTAAISLNLTHTRILDSVPAPTDNTQADSGDAVGQPGNAAAGQPETEDAARLAAEEAAKRKAEEEARAKVEADRRAKAEAREKAAEEARQKAEEKRRRSAKAKKRREEAEKKRPAQAERSATGGARSRSAARRKQATSAAHVSASAGQMLNYQAKVRAHIASHRPRSIPGRSGIVHVAFGLSKSGKLTRLKFLRSSGDRVLDEAVTSALRRAVPFPRAPKGSTSAQRYFDMPFTFNE